MSITYRQGDIFISGADVLVNPTNMDGPMGAGLAKAFAAHFPGLETAYRTAIRTGLMKMGRVHLFEAKNGQFVISLPTKSHWSRPATLHYVNLGLIALRALLLSISGPEFECKLTVAVPPLGCGLGGLNWADVKPLIEEHLGDLPGVQVLVYEP